MKVIALIILSFAAVVGTTTAVVSADVAQKAKAEAAAGAAVHTTHDAVEAPPAKDSLASFAGQTAENAEEIAAEREPFPADLPPISDGDVVDAELVLEDVVVEIAPGVKYHAWGFEGGAPGPAIHVREGQKVRITLTNNGAIPHSIDFHAARIAPDRAFGDVAPGESLTYTFEADDPGVFMYHCGTKPVLAHIANGMYGAIVVEPAENPLPPADKEYVLVSSEWYLSSAGIGEPAAYDNRKAHATMPDWVTWNGYAGQYVAHPLTADPGDTVRFWVVAAGPSLSTDFHVVGTIFERAWVNQDMTQYQTGVQTVGVPAGGGAVFDVKIDEPGHYPFVSHSFASVDMGQVGLLKVGNPKGSAGH
ncbi:MAG TPA: multicopper oxidase domain-containing protein [Gaiellaceae bacterium]|nr:multicopper oxidase domain-containing protein [Gaiellaceae bacterium]